MRRVHNPALFLFGMLCIIVFLIAASQAWSGDRRRIVATSRKLVWIGWTLSVLPCLLFLFSAFMKIHGGPEVEKGFAHLGIKPSLMLPLAVLEIGCVIVYLIPPTAVLGAILLTGFLGGAICTHLRVGDPFFVQIVVGIVVWLGIYLREERLWPLIPVRR